MEKIKIYVADTTPLKDPFLFEKKLSFFDDAQQIRIMQKKKIEDRCSSLGALLLLRHALAEHGIHAFTIGRDENGKPYLEGADTPLFNLSHSKDRAMCVLSDRAVGCDVQWMDPKISLSLANRFFTEEERALIAGAQTEEAKRLIFYRLWTLKESFAKATGEGVLRTFQSFSVIPERDLYHFHGDKREMPRHFFEPYREEQYRYAVCGERERAEPVQWVALDSL